MCRASLDDSPEGRRPDQTGPGKFGYEHDKVGEVWTADEREFNGVRLMFEMASAGWTELG